MRKAIIACGSLVSIIMVASLGCSSTPGPETEATADGVETEVVILGPDGTTSSYHYVATREQVAREAAARVAARSTSAPLPVSGPSPHDEIGHVASAIGQADCSNGDAIWLQDTASCTNFNHRICFIGQGGPLYLHNYYYLLCTGGTCFYQYWDNVIHSYWPGSENGYFAYGFSQESFTSGGNCTSTTPPWATLTLTD